MISESTPNNTTINRVDDNDFISGYRHQYDKSLELFNRTVGADSSASSNGFFGALMILLIGFY